MIAQIKKVLVIAGTSLRRIIADRSFAVFLVAMPLAIIAILGITLQPLMTSEFKPVQPFKVALVQNDPHATVMNVFESRPEIIDIRLARDADEARQWVLQRNVDAAVLVPEAFPDQAATLVATPGTVAAGVLVEMLRSVAVQIEEVKSHHISVARTAVAASSEVRQDHGLPHWLDQAGSFGYYAVAMTAMFAMFAAHSAMVVSAKDRASDTYARIRTLGVTPASFMTATTVTSLVVAVFFVSLLTVATALLFSVRWGNVGSWSLLTLLGASAISSLSLLVMALVPGAEHVEGAGNAIFNVLAFLGGSMTPLHVLPEWFRGAFSWIPNRAMLTGYLKLAQGADIAEISQELLTLAAATAILFTLGWTILNYRAKRGDH